MVPPVTSQGLFCNIANQYPTCHQVHGIFVRMAIGSLLQMAVDISP